MFYFFFTELRGLILEGNELLAHLREYEEEYEDQIAAVEEIINLLWQRNLSQADELVQKIDRTGRTRLCDLELLGFIVHVRAEATSIGGLPLWVH